MKQGRKLFFLSLTLMYFFILQITSANGCLHYKFVNEYGFALKNHLIESIPNIPPFSCRSLCAQKPLCFSVNMKSRHRFKVTCELNNSSKAADPQDFQAEAGSEYEQMAVSFELFCFISLKILQ